MKKAIGLRSYPLRAIADFHVEPDGHRGHPTLRVVLRSGTDLLRSLLRNAQPTPDHDPDTLIPRKGGTVPEAHAFVNSVRRRLDHSTGPGALPALVDSGQLPLTVKGPSTPATFDGEILTLEVNSWTASAAKKNSYPRAFRLRQ